MVAAAFFDVDRTLLAGSSLLAMVRPLRRAGLISVSTVLTSALRQVWFRTNGLNDEHLAGAGDTAAAAVRGQLAAEMAALGERLVPEVLPRLLYAAALQEIEAHRRAGRRIYLVSSSPVQLVSPLGRLLGADGIAATEAEIDATGRFTGALVTFCSGQAKADAIARLSATDNIDLSASYAYGDSVNDRFMLASVGHPVATNPDRRLRRLARSRGWEVKSFVPTSRMRPPKPHVRRLRITARRVMRRGHQGHSPDVGGIA